jgi:hypothetical protein
MPKGGGVGGGHECFQQVRMDFSKYLTFVVDALQGGPKHVHSAQARGGVMPMQS